MIKLTVMYTLPEGADHEAFLKWRTTEHQKENMGIPGVIKSDFYAVREAYTHETTLNDKLQEPGFTEPSHEHKPASKGRLQEQSRYPPAV